MSFLAVVNSTQSSLSLGSDLCLPVAVPQPSSSYSSQQSSLWISSKVRIFQSCQSRTNLIILVAMLILRIWYLFGSQKWIQYGMMALWIVSMVVSLVYTGEAATHLELLGSNIDQGIFTLAPGCRVARPPTFWKIFLPSLILHVSLKSWKLPIISVTEHP